MEKRRKYLLAFALVVVGLTIFYLQNFRSSYCINSLLPKSKIVQRALAIQPANNRDSTQQIGDGYSFKNVLWFNTKQIPFKKRC